MLAVRVATVVAAYVLGTVPVADLVVRRLAPGVDLRAVGDRNPGAWNTMDQLGVAIAWRVFLGDGLKGALGAALGLAAGGFGWGAACLFAVMVGHSYPAWRLGRGGRSVMAYVGGALVLTPLAAITGLSLLVVLVALHPHGKLPATAALATYPIWVVGLYGPGVELVVMVALLCSLGLRTALAMRFDQRPPAAGSAPEG